MILSVLVPLALAVVARQQTPQSEEFTTKNATGITLQYSISMQPQDGDAFLSTLSGTREVITKGLGVTLPEVVVTVRKRNGGQCVWYTDGEDKVFFDFPSEQYVTRLQFNDERILKYSIPSFLQLWLFHSLSSTAGLDRRILDSLSDYANYLLHVEMARGTKNGKPPEPPSGPAQCWYQLDTVHEQLTTFVLNVLSSKKLAAHLLGRELRSIASGASEDPGVVDLFDLVSPREPLLAGEDLAPKPVLSPEQQTPGAPKISLRLGRVATFNGMPLLDTEDPPIPVADRDHDFRELFDWVVKSAPATKNELREQPPVVRGIGLWPLYFEFRARVLKARDNLDYFLVLREFLARFDDCGLALKATRATPVLPGSPLWAGVVGLDFARAGEHVYVARVTPDTEAAKAGVKPGLEVVTVDGRRGIATLAMLADFTQAFDSCPSRQRAEARALNLLLTGAEGSSCKLVVHDPKTPVDPKHPDTGTTTFEFVRVRPPARKPDPLTVEKKDARDGVVVLKVNQFAGDAMQKFALALDQVAQQQPPATGLVIDLRGNEGFYDLRAPSRVSLGMLARLLPPTSSKLAFGSIVMRDRKDFNVAVEFSPLEVAPTAAGARVNCPIAVLTDAWTGGEAEWFVLGIQTAKLGTVVGRPTAGSVTIPKEPAEAWQSLLKSHVDVGVSFGMVVRADGSHVQGVGITPQVVVEPNPADLAAGVDTTLEAAVKILVK